MEDGIKIEFPNKKRQEEYDCNSQQIADRYVTIYNEQAKKNGAHAIVSVFSRNRMELDIEAKKQIQVIVFNLNFIKGNVRAYPSDDQEIIKFSNDIQHSLSNTFPASQGFVMGLHPTKEQLKQEIKKYCELTYDHHLGALMEKLDLLYSLKKSLEDMLLHKYAIEAVISEALSKGYPQILDDVKPDDGGLFELVGEYQSLDFYDMIYPEDVEEDGLEDQDEIQSKSGIQKRRGRPLEVPQDPIEHRVKVLLVKARREDPGYKKFWHHTGRWKGKPNKRQIKLRLIEDGLTGDVDDTTIRRRINKALKAIRQK